MICRRLLIVAGSGLLAGRASAHQPAARSSAELMDALMWGRESVGAPFSLVAQDGRRMTDRDFRGKLMLVYFGFTNCPDVCPTDLQQIAALLRVLGPAASQVRPAFITLDPERDSPERLTAYLRSFDSRIVGLTGDLGSIRAVADGYLMFFRKAQLSRSGYTIDHAAVTYLIDREGRYLGFFPPGTSAARMLQILRPYLRPS